MHTFSLLTLLFTVLLLSGCGNRTHPVRGQVVFEDGSAANELTGYMVNFQSLEHNASATGIIQPDGTFTVGTFNDGDGALRGRQRVAITPPAVTGDEPPPPLLIPVKYGDFAKSELEVEITSAKNELTIKVERLKKK